MRTMALVSLGVLLLAGCSSEPVSWEQSNQVTIESNVVELKSNLWLNKMPTIGEVQDTNLHGALYLVSDTDLPAELDIESVTLKQGEESWILDGNLLELRTHSENQWEVVFVTQLTFDAEKVVDVALQLSVDGQLKSLVEKQVKIDVVY